jgi:broad specificity phosphatase PhoE
MSSGVELWLIRHGETEWSLDGRHTSVTDIPLTEQGRQRAVELREFLRGVTFAGVFVSPMQRARETCEIAGLGAQAVVEAGLMEWNYGEAEGKTTKQIREELGKPNWSVWSDGVVGGETVEAVGARADEVIARALAVVQAPGSENPDPHPTEQLRSAGTPDPGHPSGGKVALFAHAHILRILAARWLGLPAVDGKLFALGTGSVSVLGFERETRVMVKWNRGFEKD